MKYTRFLFLVLLFPLFSGAPVHKFYVSITNIEYVKENSSLQIITKIFIDDIENALRKEYDKSIALDSKKETEEMDAILKQYILQKIKISINGTPAKLDYIGKEYETDMVVAYIEVTGITNLKTVEIENKVLTELFSEQKNIIHLKTSKSRRSLILEKGEPRGKLNFNQ